VVAGPVVRITSPVAIRACQPCDSQGAVSHPRPAVQVMTAPSMAAAAAAAAARSTPPAGVVTESSGGVPLSQSRP